MLSFMLLIMAVPVHAADARAHLLIEITGNGNVYVTQKWNDIAGLERLVYDTGTEDLGVLEAPVHEGHAELNYDSFELLRRDGDRLRLIIARLDNGGDWLDFDITVSYPVNLEFINADPEPSFMNSSAGGLMWSIADQRELILTASFSGQLNDSEARGNSGNGAAAQAAQEDSRNRSNNSSAEQDSAAGRPRDETPPADPAANDGSRMLRPDAEGGAAQVAQDGGAAQVAQNADPEQSGQLDHTRDSDNPTSADSELLLDGDPLLMEFRMLINAARREGKADEDFLKALEKLLLKFFYLLDAMDATDEYEP